MAGVRRTHTHRNCAQANAVPTHTHTHTHTHTQKTKQTNKQNRRHHNMPVIMLCQSIGLAAVGIGNPATTVRKAREDRIISVPPGVQGCFEDSLCCLISGLFLALRSKRRISINLQEIETLVRSLSIKSGPRRRGPPSSARDACVVGLVRVASSRACVVVESSRRARRREPEAPNSHHAHTLCPEHGRSLGAACVRKLLCRVRTSTIKTDLSSRPSTALHTGAHTRIKAAAGRPPKPGACLGAPRRQPGVSAWR